MNRSPKEHLQRFLNNIYADVAARVFLNWLGDGQPHDAAAFWLNESAMVATAQTAAVLPPGVEHGSFSHALYDSWMAEQNDRLPFHEETWSRL